MSKRSHGGPGSIPSRWLNCPNKSDEIIAEKFVAFKTPLSEKFDSQVQGHFFYPSMLFDYVKTYHKVGEILQCISALVLMFPDFVIFSEKNRIMDRLDKHFEILR